MSRGAIKVGLFSVVLGLLVLPMAASATPIASGAVTFNNDDTPPFFFVGTLTYSVYAPGDPDNPVDDSTYPTVNTDYTYVYTLANAASPISIVPLDGLDIELRDGVSVTATGTIDDGNPNTVAPSAIIIGSLLLSYDFLTMDTMIPQGGSSQPFFFTSPFEPGDVVLSCWFDGVSEDEIGSLAGPSDIGGMSPRTIGFWKSQYDYKKLKFTPEQLDAFLTEAVALSGGVFVDGLDLRTHLTSKGNRTMLIKAKQQFAAYLLNITSGLLGQDVEIFSDLTTATTVRGARIEIQNLILTETDLERAKTLADDINNGFGVGTPS